jgi:hypothetical protein
MEPITSRRAVLQFKNASEEPIRFSIPRAVATMAEATARGHMNTLINLDIIRTGAGVPASIKRMDIVTTVRTPLV